MEALEISKQRNWEFSLVKNVETFFDYLFIFAKYLEVF